MEDGAARKVICVSYNFVNFPSFANLLIPNGQIILVPAETNLEVVVFRDELCDCLLTCVNIINHLYTDKGGRSHNMP